jgi:hypothetical protein
VTWELPAGVAIDGHVLDRDGSPIGPFAVLPFAYDGGIAMSFFLSRGLTDLDGYWTTTIDPGSYGFYLAKKNPGDSFPQIPPFESRQYLLTQIDGGETVDIELDYALVDLQIKRGGVPVNYACRVEAQQDFGASRTYFVTAQDTGFETMPVWKSGLGLSIYPEEGHGVAAGFVDSYLVSGDASIEVNLPVGFVQSGIARANGVPLSGVTMSFEPQSAAIVTHNYTTPPTGAGGQFSISVPAGTYRVRARMNGGGLSGELFVAENVVVSAAADRSFDLDFSLVSVRMLAGGVHATGGSLVASNDVTHLASFGTISAGDPAILRMPPGTYTFMFVPENITQLRPFHGVTLVVDEDTHEVLLDFQDLPI